MSKTIICTAGNTAALRFAREELVSRGFTVIDTPEPDVTHLLLPVPSFEADGRIKGGGILPHILADLPESITVIGGKLDHPALAGLQTIDLLQNSDYVAQNAFITADRALRIAMQELPMVLRNCPVLVIGWGRIGKCLGRLLQALEAKVTIAARKNEDRAMIAALGYASVDTAILSSTLGDYRVIFNTVPVSVLDASCVDRYQPNCLKIDLASQKGLPGNNVIWARGLPGKDAPETSGKLIADTVAGFLIGKENRL